MLTLYMHPVAWGVRDVSCFTTLQPPEPCEIYAIRFLPSDDLQWLRLHSAQVEHTEKLPHALPCADLAGPPEQLSLMPLFSLQPHQRLTIEVRNTTKGFLREAYPFLVVATKGTAPWEFMMRNPAQR